jgi:serine/threonine protein kinase/HAMP domain-containing protein
MDIRCGGPDTAPVTPVHPPDPSADPDATVIRTRLLPAAVPGAGAEADPDATVLQAAASLPRPDRPLPQAPPLALPAGFRLHEYRIDRVLGQGGFGITYLATDVNLHARVAIKEYLPEEIAFRAGDRSVSPNASRHRDRYRAGMDSFLAEARTLASFRHPALVRVARFFEAHRTAYMVLEYERGEPLKTWWPQHRDIGEKGLVELLLPLCEGLAVVHAAGVLHRDIKPDNIQVRADDGRLVLLDFGSAGQVVAVADQSAVVVTPGYAPIEQYGLGRQGPWTDVYALAATLYWCVTGAKPPDAELRAVNPSSYRPAAEVAPPGCDQAFLRAIDAGLATDPAQRPQDIVDFRRALFADHLASLNLRDALKKGDTVIDGDTHAPLHVRWVLRGRRALLAVLHPPQWPLAVKMTLAMLATALLPMLVTAAYNLRGSTDAVAAAELRNVEQVAHGTAGRLSQFITSSRHLARGLGSDADLAAALAAPATPATPATPAGAGTAAALQAKLARLVEAHPDVQRIVLADAAGRPVAASDEAAVGDLATERYFLEALQGRTQVSGLLLPPGAWLPVLVVAEPVAAADGSVPGVLVLHLRGSSVVAILDEVRHDSALTPFLVDRDGVLLHHLHEDLVFQSLEPLPAARQAALRAERRFGRDSITSIGETTLAAAMRNAQTTGSVSYVSALDQQPQIAGYAPVTAHEWVVGVSQSRSAFEAPMALLYEHLLWSVGLVGLLFAGLALRFARGIVQPIRSLTRAADALKAGDFDSAGVEVRRRDEIGQLARTFSVMIDVLRQRERERRGR